MLILAKVKGISFQRTMGVFYDVRVHLAENSDDFVGKKGTTVNMGIRKAQYAGLEAKQRSPTATTGPEYHNQYDILNYSWLSQCVGLCVCHYHKILISPEKGFMFGSGKVSLEVGLERETYYHGEDIPLNISINNQSKKAVKNIRVGYIHNPSPDIFDTNHYSVTSTRTVSSAWSMASTPVKLPGLIHRSAPFLI